MICRMLLLALITLSTATSADDLHFERRIRPLLIERCCKCHSAEQQKGGLLLDSRAALLQGGETGPAIDPANPDNSLLLQAVRQENGLEMPPDGKLTNEQIQALTQWIRQGAPWPGTASTETATTAAAASATIWNMASAFAAIADIAAIAAITAITTFAAFAARCESQPQPQP